MRSPHADDSADELRADVAASNLPRNLAAQREGDADGRIEMSTPTGSECQYQDREDRAGRQRIVQLFLRSTGKRVPSRALAATRHKRDIRAESSEKSKDGMSICMARHYPRVDREATALSGSGRLTTGRATKSRRCRLFDDH